MNSKDAIATAKAIIDVMKLGKLTYDEAKAKCQPYLDIVNAKGKEISKGYGKRWADLTFTKLAR
jgi:hypothetical protein